MTQDNSSGVTFEDALTQIGEFGKAQIVNVALTGAAWLPTGYVILLMVFTNLDPIKHHNWACTSKVDASCLSVHQLSSPGQQFCSLQDSQWVWTSSKMSIISDFNLACEEVWKVGWSSSLFFFGFLLGSGAFGRVSDHQGRKVCLISSSVVTALACFCCSLSPDYWTYVLFRSLSGFGASGMGLSGYILGTEPVGMRYRSLAALGNQLFFVFGEIVLVLIAWRVHNWRSLQIAGALLCLLLTANAVFLPESPRWLLAKGRVTEATAILKTFAVANNKVLHGQLVNAPPKTQESLGLWSTLRSDWHILRRFLVLGYAWLVLCGAYYGISIALSELHASPYVTFLVSALVEIPSYLAGAYFVDRIGRHLTMGAGMMIAAIGCATCTFAPAGAGQIGLAAMGKFGAASAFAMASVYTSELFPTLMRSAVLGSMNQAARVGAMVSPLIVMAGGHLPFIIFGSTCALGGLMLATLPETLGLPMPDTVQDLQRLNSIFSMWESGQHLGWKESAAFLLRTHGNQDTSTTLSAPAGVDKHGYASVLQQDSEMQPVMHAWHEEDALLPAPERSALHRSAS